MKAPLLLIPFCLSVAGPVHAEPDATAGFFPYAKGRYWLYDGTVKFMRDQQVVEKKITGWKSEVLDTVAGKDFKAALLKGGARDLAWYQEGRERGLSIIILTQSGEFHEVDRDPETLKVFADIQSTGRIPAGLLDDSNLFFRTTMQVGDRYGDPEQVRLGPRYCWVVDNIFTEKPDPAIKGLPPGKQVTTHILTFRSSPDHTIVKFAAGIGITDYHYVHHGTPGNCEMRLVETGDPKPVP